MTLDACEEAALAPYDSEVDGVSCLPEIVDERPVAYDSPNSSRVHIPRSRSLWQVGQRTQIMWRLMLETDFHAPLRLCSGLWATSSMRDSPHDSQEVGMSGYRRPRRPRTESLNGLCPLYVFCFIGFRRIHSRLIFRAASRPQSSLQYLLLVAGGVIAKRLPHQRQSAPPAVTSVCSPLLRLPT
jgi:hypothetical protein